MVSGPVLLKIKGKSWIFIFWGSKKRKKFGKVERNRSNFGLRSSRWYQKDAEGRRGYFRKIWAWKTLKKQSKSIISPDFSQFFPWTLPKTREFPYKRLGAICLIPFRPTSPSSNSTVQTITYTSRHLRILELLYASMDLRFQKCTYAVEKMRGRKHPLHAFST